MDRSPAGIDFGRAGSPVWPLVKGRPLWLRPLPTELPLWLMTEGQRATRVVRTRGLFLRTEGDSCFTFWVIPTSNLGVKYLLKA